MISSAKILLADYLSIIKRHRRSKIRKNTYNFREKLKTLKIGQLYLLDQEI